MRVRVRDHNESRNYATALNDCMLQQRRVDRAGHWVGWWQREERFLARVQREQRTQRGMHYPPATQLFAVITRGAFPATCIWHAAAAK
jgi:hypothetical protein